MYRTSMQRRSFLKTAGKTLLAAPAIAAFAEADPPAKAPVHVGAPKPKAAFKPTKNRLERDIDLPKYELLIKPQPI